MNLTRIPLPSISCQQASFPKPHHSACWLWPHLLLFSELSPVLYGGLLSLTAMVPNEICFYSFSSCQLLDFFSCLNQTLPCLYMLIPLFPLITPRLGFCCGSAGDCCCSVTKSHPTLCDPWTVALQTSLVLTVQLISWSLPKFTSSVLFMAPLKSYCFWKCFLILPSLHNYLSLVPLRHFIYTSIMTRSILLSFYFLFTLFFL